MANLLQNGVSYYTDDPGLQDKLILQNKIIIYGTYMYDKVFQMNECMYCTLYIVTMFLAPVIKVHNKFKMFVLCNGGCGG